MVSQTASNESLDLLTLEEAINLALQNNPLVRISTLEIEKSEESISELRTHRLPVFQVSILGSTLLTPMSFDSRKARSAPSQ